MSDYIKHVFNDGDILTAEQLNAMNDQIELDANQVDTVNNQLSTITGQLDGKASLTGATFIGDVNVNSQMQTYNLVVGTSSDPTKALAYFAGDVKFLNGVTYLGAMGAYLNGTDVSYMPNGIKTRLFLTSPNGTLFEIKVSNNGEISAISATYA